MTDERSGPNLMSGFESIMWEMERDPGLASTFSNLSMLDGPPDRAILRSRMSKALIAVPRLRQRVVATGVPWELPRWVEDEDMDLDHHLQWVDMGGEASIRDLYDLTATLSRDPLDRNRPLWQFVVIEGLKDGRAAMLQRLHHTITDGEGGIRLSVAFVDFERNPPTPEPKPAANDPLPGTEPDIRPDADEIDGDGSRVSWMQRTLGAADAMGPLASAPMALAGAISNAAAVTSALPAKASELVGVAKSTVRQARVGKRRSTLWTERSLGRWFGTTTLSLADVLDAAHQMSGSANDLFIAGAADAAGRLHTAAGRPVDQMRVSMPVSTRHDRSAGGNAFSPTQMLVPTSEMAPAERIAAIHDIVTEVREERAIAAMEGAASAAAMLPPALILRTGQYLTNAVDFVCSNVRAAPFDLFIGGAHMQCNYPIGPLAGTAFNLTTMSYRGWLFVGLHVDTTAVDDPEELLDALNESYSELLRSAGLPRRKPEFE